MPCRTDKAGTCHSMQASKPSGAQQQVLECLNNVKVTAPCTANACHLVVAAHVAQEAPCTHRDEAKAALMPPSWNRSMRRWRRWRQMQAFRCDCRCMRPASCKVHEQSLMLTLGMAQEPTRSPLLPGRWRLLYTSKPGTASPIQQTFVGVDAFKIFQEILNLEEGVRVNNIVDFGPRIGQLKVNAYPMNIVPYIPVAGSLSLL